MLDFRILGTLEVWEDGDRLDLGDERQQAFLAILLLEPGRVVSLERLVRAVWGSCPPSRAVRWLHSYGSQLQETLGTEVLEARPTGYRVQVRPGQLDVDRFRVLLEAADRASPIERIQKLRQALALWRGPPLADVACRSFAESYIADLERLRRTAEARLRAG